MKGLSGVLSRQRDRCSFPATQANFEDLLVVMQRYQVRVADSSRGAFAKGLEYLTAIHRARAGVDDDHVPAGLFKGEYLPFQREGVTFMRAQRRSLNADDMGLGKTIQAFGFLDELNEWPAVVVCQSHVLRHWERKIGEFMDMRPADGGLLDRAGLTWVTLRGQKAKRRTPTADLYLIHYLCLHGWIAFLRDRGIRTVVFDEVQEARHTGTRKSDAILALARAAKNVAGLSGTPIYNRGIEIFNVMNMISRGSLGLKTEFQRTWCSETDREVVENPAQLGQYLQDRGYMIRRRKEDVLTQLPAKRRVIEQIDGDNEQFAALVREAAALAREAADTDDPFDRGRMEAEAIARARRATGIAKAPAIVAFVRGLLEAGEPTLVFCHHHAVHDAVLGALEEFKPASITGRQTTGGKDIAQRRFEEGETNLCLIALRAATGLDGLQKRARVVVFAELDWSPAIHKQAEDRAHRMGQQDSVLSYFLVTDLGTDPDMMAALQLKESQFTGLMQDREETEDDRAAAREASKQHMNNVLEMLRSIR
jgi:superfamily II DNA or RNA helicase